MIRAIGIIGAIVGILFFFNVSRFTPKVDNPWQRPTGDTLLPRLCLWEGTRDMLLERPIFGAGLSGFKELYSEKYFTCDAEPLEYPHNWVLNFWAEMGIVGLVAFLWILTKFFSLLSKQLLYSNDQIPMINVQTNFNVQKRNVLNILKLKIENSLKIENWSLNIAIAAAMAYWLVHGLVDVPYFKNDLALEFWVIIALAEILARHQSLPDQNQQ